MTSLILVRRSFSQGVVFSAFTMSSNKEIYIYNGDIVSLCCQNESGYVLYSKPISHSRSEQSDDLFISLSKDDFLECNLMAMFCITHGSEPSDEYDQLEAGKLPNFDQRDTCADDLSSELMKIVYGCTIKLQHQASGKYLSVKQEQICLTNLSNKANESNKNEHLFRIIPPGHHERKWGKHIKHGELIKLEVVSQTQYQFSYKERTHLSSENGTVLSISSHCQNYMKLHPLSIKAGNIVMLASQKIDGYVSAQGLRRWQKSFFNNLPFSGDTFLEIKGSNESEPLMYGDECKIKIFLTQESILKSEEIFQIKAIDHPMQRKEVFSHDVISLTAKRTTQQDDIKHLSVNVKKSSKDTFNDERLDLVLENYSKMNCFKVLKVEKNAVIDIIHIKSITSALHECNQGSNAQRVICLIKGLQESFTLTENKTRLANMLRTVKTVDIIITLLRKLAVLDDEKSHEACICICESLQLYVENGTIKSIHYLTEKAEFRILEEMIDKRFGTEIQKLIISLHFKDCRIFGELIPVKKLNVKDTEIAGLMSILALNGKRINRKILDEVCKALESEIVDPDAKEVLNSFCISSDDLETEGVACSRLSCAFLQDKIGSSEFWSSSFSEGFEFGSLLITMKNKIYTILLRTESQTVNALTLSILVFLIYHGFYSKDDEIKQITSILLEKLKLSELASGVMKEMILKIKFLALLSLQLLLKQRIHLSVKALLSDFSNNSTIFIKQDHSLTNETIRYARLKRESDEDFTNVVVQSPQDPSYGGKITQNAVQRQLRINFKPGSFPIFHTSTENNTKCQDLCKCLISLIDNSDFDVSVMSAELLFDIFNIENHILSCAKEDVYVYSPEVSVNGHEILVTMTNTVQLITKLTQRQHIMDEDKENIVTNLDNFSKLCVLDESETEPNVTMQAIAYSCGLFDVILEYVLGQRLSDSQDHEKILSKCFTFLQRVARKNKRAQNKLFVSFYDFLEFKTAMHPIIHLLNEVFYDNIDLCINLTDTDISNIFICAITRSNAVHYELTVTLRVIIDTINPATSMQEYISKLIYDYSTDVLGHLLDKENPLYINKIKLLKKDDSDPNLYLLLNITDLIASCTTGHCHYAESVCCQFYTLDDLLNILFDQEIAIHRKLPFIRLLNSTYLVTERDSEACATALANNLNFWDFNKKIVSKTHRLWKDSNKGTAEQNLRKRNNFYWSIPLLMHSGNLATEIDKNFLYIFEGLIPLLIAFYLSGRSKSCSDRFTEAKKELVMNLKRFADFHLPFVTEKIETLENSIICPESIHHHQTDVNDSQTSSHHDSFQMFVEKCYDAYTNKSVTRNSPMQSSEFHGCDLDLEDTQRRLLIPNDPVFQKFIDEFKDSKNHLKQATKKPSTSEIETKDLKVKSLKATKLLFLLRTLIQKQKPLGLRKIDLENMTLTTLKLICGIVYSGIKEVKSSKHKEKQPNDFVASLQKILLDQGIVPMLFDLLHHPNVDITFQVIACLNVLLYFGNEESQQIIISFTQKDQNLIMIVHQILRKFYTKASIVQEAKSSTNQSIIDSRVAIVLDVIASLCDGQQKDIQDALRDEQIFDESSIINQVSFVLLYIVNSVNFEKNEDAIVVAQSATHALIEMCAGNYKNQIVVFKAQVVISINCILGKDSSSVNEVNWKLYELQCSSMELLEILLEEIDKNSLSLASCIAKHFEISTLLQRMFNFWESALIRSRLSNEQFNKDLCRGYNILRRIADFKEISVDSLVRKKYFKEVFKGNNTTEAEKMWKSCTNWSSRVEIIYQTQNCDKILTRAYFPCDPHADFSAIEKETLLLNIKRRTPHEKLIDLLKWTKELKLGNDQKKKTNEKGKLKLFYWILQTSTIRNICLFLLTILLNIFVFFLKSPSNDNVPINGVCKNIEANNETCDNASSIYFQPIFDPEAPEWYYPVHYTFSALHLVLAMFMVLCYFYENKHRIHFRMFWFNKIMYKYKKEVKRRKLLYNFLNKVSCGKIYFSRPEPAEYYQIFALSFQPIYRILFLIFSILGIWKGYFLCGCMIYPFLENSVILHIIQALKRSAYQLLIIFALGIVFIYIYAVVSFALISNYFSEEKDEFCNNVFQCFVTILRVGLLDTLGSALDVRPSEEYQPNFSIVGGRVIYDLVFFIVVTVLGLNLVIVILIDRFSEMRQKKDKVNEDNQNRCFICSKEKDKFDRQCGGKAFQKHLDDDHNIWKYIHFILYLQSLHHNDHNALEKYVLQQVKDESIDFFPIFQAKVLELKKPI